MNSGPQQPPPRRPAPRRDDLQHVWSEPSPQPEPQPLPSADATQFTSAFSGSLPPPPAPPRRQGPPPNGQRPGPQGMPQMPPRPRPRPVDPPTEVIPRVEDDYDEYDEPDDYYDDDEYDDVEDKDALPPESFRRKAVRGVGEALITMGLIVLLFVVYEVYVTDLLSAEKQQDATAALDSEWSSNTVTPPPVADPNRQSKLNLIEGKAFAKMYIPVFGNDWKFSVVEGTTDKHLEIGPGHYKDTAQPGEAGNFSIAGHRVGKGAPFNDLDLLESCNAIVVQTQTQWFVYRVLPMSSEVAGWAANPKSKQASCTGIAPLATTLGDAYAKTVGQEIVVPTQGEVIAPIPHQVNATVPPEQLARLLTLTTCHPRFSDRQRLIVHAIETKSYPVADGFVPPEMTEG